MSSDDENDVKEPKASRTSTGEKKKSIRKRLGLPKKNRDGSKSRRDNSRKSDREHRQPLSAAIVSSTEDNSSISSSSISSSSTSTSTNTSTNNSTSISNNDSTSSSIRLLDVNDSIASDSANASLNSAASIATSSGENKKERISRDARRIGKGVMKRVRSLSRSRGSRRRGNDESDSDSYSSDHSSSSSDSSSSNNSRRPKSTVVTVTSCRSDGYYNQKAPGSTSKLPRKAPTNLKLFHELAVGLKDAYTAVGQTPTKPEMGEQQIVDESTGETKTVAVMSAEEFAGRTILWDFIGNIDFVS